MADQPDGYDALIRAPFGRIGVRVCGDALAAIDFLPGSRPLRAPASAAASRAVQEIEAYLRDPRAPFSAATIQVGSPFRRRVWRALQRIPCGATRSYGELARSLGTSARAVGGACRDNPLPLVVPCHRVVARHGSGGFMGARTGFALQVKHWLLSHEGAG